MIGERLRELRERAKLTQNDVAKKLNITRPAYTQYETGVRNPDAETLSRLADILGTTVDYLLGRTDDPIPTKHAVEEISRGHSEIGEPVTGFRYVPVLGSIHAGEPIPPIHEAEEWVLVPENGLKEGKQYFYLRVKGDCMAAGPNPIHDGYMVLVEATPEVNNWEIAVVGIPGEDEAVLRRVRYLGEVVMLTADNPKYDPIPLDGKKVRIYGRVVKVEFTPAAAKEVRNHIHMEE